MPVRPLVVVQNNFVERLTGPAAEAARGLGITLHDISSGDDIAGKRPLPDGGPWNPILVIGSILFAHQWARGNAQLSSWIDWHDDAYDAELWARLHGDRFMNHLGRSTTVGELIAENAPSLHLRPRSGMKMVGWYQPDEDHAGQMSVAGLVADAADLLRMRVDPVTAVWASPPRPIEAEVRVWMIEGRPVAWSTYRIGGRHVRLRDHPLVPAAVEAATAITAVFAPGRAHVTDVALVDGEWRLVEYNPIHSSGWYDADPATIIAAWFTAQETRP